MLVYGKNVIREAIFAKRTIQALYIDEKFSDRAFLEFLDDRGVVYETRSKGDLSQMAGQTTHQGVVAIVQAYGYVTLEEVIRTDGKQRFLILDGLEDPHNLGAIMRTAEATRLDAIILSKKNQVPLNATVAKVSSGAIEHVPVALVSNISQAIETLKKANVWVIGADGSAEKTYDDMPKDVSLAVVLGNEGEGIRPLIRQHCDLLVRIPMYGKINALNVSVAAALMMYKMME